MSVEPVLEPLSLTPAQSVSVAVIDAMAADVTVQCLMCDIKYRDPDDRKLLLKHLILDHNFVIADVNLIADFPGYIAYWRTKFRDEPIKNFCSVIKTNTDINDTDPSEFYFLLCDALPEDKTLRGNLQKRVLDSILEQQQMERADTTFCKKCLFCRHQFTLRTDFFDHMRKKHGFSVGNADNLVYTSELIDLLDKTLHNLQCLYCERTYTDRHVLKEHMRKKQHKKINPKNTKYDKFYIINYMELGRNWESLKADDDPDEQGFESDGSSVVDEWSDWKEEGGQAVCLFCEMSSTNTSQVLQHMKEIHLFDMSLLKEELQLNFYQQVKLINYIRRQMHQCVCPKCEEKFQSRTMLLDHMNFSSHVSQLPDTSVWDQAQYFFPTYENDVLLCGLEDTDGAQSQVDIGSNVVVAEDCPVKYSILLENDVREDLFV